MPHPQDYLDALAEFTAADGAVLLLAAQLRSFTEHLISRPGETAFVGIAGEPSPPLDQLVPGKRWDADVFPSPPALQAALRRRAFAKGKAMRLWEELALAQRKGAPLPPSA